MFATLELKPALVFYRAYHRNPVNQAIHFVFVPAIVFSVLVLLEYIPRGQADAPLPRILATQGVAGLARECSCNVGFWITAFYCLLYTYWDFTAGLSWALLLALPMWSQAHDFAIKVENAWMWALGLKALGWVMQIWPGHAIFEKRRPALMDSAVQAFLTGPLFVWLELLFGLGFKKELHMEVKAATEAAVKDQKVQ